MDINTYRDMHLLTELTRNPTTTQRELSQRIGVALGLTNLMLRRLVKKGYIKISGTKRSRLRYLITPKGILEKSRLTYEFIQYSLQLYGRVRRFLREQLMILSSTDNTRVVLYGTGELAEVAFLIIREIGLELVAVVDDTPSQPAFLGYPIQSLAETVTMSYDRMIVSSLPAPGQEAGLQRLVERGAPRERLILLPIQEIPHSEHDSLVHSQAAILSLPDTSLAILAEDLTPPG